MFSGEYSWPSFAGQLVGRLLDRGGRLDTPYRAYVAAWRVAERDGCWDEGPELSSYLERWRTRVHPRDVPRGER